jgi:hypothetical protein
VSISQQVVKIQRIFFSATLTANGPAIKAFCVAERMKAGAEKLNRVSVPVPAVMNEAWRSFCHQVASFLSYTSVAVQGYEVTRKLSRYNILIKGSGAPACR